MINIANYKEKSINKHYRKNILKYCIIPLTFALQITAYNSYFSRVISLGLMTIVFEVLFSLDFNNLVNNEQKSSYLPLENV